MRDKLIWTVETEKSGVKSIFSSKAAAIMGIDRFLDLEFEEVTKTLGPIKVMDGTDELLCFTHKVTGRRVWVSIKSHLLNNAAMFGIVANQEGSGRD
jgi:hypothetical protein